MALRTRLDLRQIQRLGLSDRVLAALHILRLPAADLAEALAREAETNPFLLPGLPPPPPAPLAMAPGADALDLLAARAPDWQMDLLHQIAQRALPPGIARLAALLVGELDDRGWLDVPLADLAAQGGHDAGDLARALAVVQSCGPPGVGARDLDECLALQLVDLGLTPDQARAMLTELPRFARRDWPGLRRALGLTQAQVLARADLLRRVSPRPIAPPPGPEHHLRPDLVLTRGPLGEVGVDLARDHLPRPAIDLALARSAQAQGFGTDLLDRARALVRAVDNRGATLLRVGQWLVQRQAPALRDGPGALRAATRADCAADLGLHPSTVGRAVAGKALMADGRLWPLARLFSTPAPGTAPGTARGTDPAPGGGTGDAPAPAAARAIAHRIAALIAAEPSARPRSDQAIAQILGTEGVDIARRTVAKYRSGLRIPAAHLRRTPG
jgi:RNA polymerase sigma-54 factor